VPSKTFYHCKLFYCFGKEVRLFRKPISIIILSLLVASALALAFDIRPAFAQAETIYINADGSISPPTAHINTLDNITYVLVGNISEGITVQRSNIVIDGNGHTLTPASGNNYGFSLANVDNVTITNATIIASQQQQQNIPGFLLANTNDSRIVSNNITVGDPFGITYIYAISLTSCFGNNVSSNRGTGTTNGIVLYNSGNNIVSNNHFDNGIFGGVLLYSSNNNTLRGNHVSGYAQFAGQPLEGTFELSSSDNNTLIGNDVTDNGQGILLESSDNNVLIANNVTGNVGYAGGGQINPPLGFGIYIEFSLNNAIYHNNFVGNIVLETYNTNPIVPNNVMSDGSPNVWDDGYPSGGNFWSDYNGTDLYSRPYQNVTGSDGIGDAPYVIGANNIDHYPLLGAFSDFNVAGGVDVQVVSNSTVFDFQFNGTALLFNVSAGNGNATFCKLCLPTALSNGTPTVFVNGTQVQYEQLTGLNSNLGYLYFTYGSILPEFPDPLILTIFMVATLLAIVIHKKKYGSSIKGHA
jgi:parallel beta-helix repeat protein